MIRFSFELNDTDASNLVGIVQDRINDARDKGKEFRATVDANPHQRVARANADWYEAHTAYLEGLLQKILVGHKSV